MRKKLMILAGLFMMFQFGFSKFDMKSWHEHKEELVNSIVTTEEAIQKLVKADALGYDYYDIYLNVLLKNSDSEELLEIVFKNSETNAGKIVALKGMYKVNKREYNEMKKKLYGKVMIDYGCWNKEENARGYLERIETYLETQVKNIP